MTSVQGIPPLRGEALSAKSSLYSRGGRASALPSPPDEPEINPTHTQNTKQKKHPGNLDFLLRDPPPTATIPATMSSKSNRNSENQYSPVDDASMQDRQQDDYDDEFDEESYDNDDHGDSTQQSAAKSSSSKSKSKSDGTGGGGGAAGTGTGTGGGKKTKSARERNRIAAHKCRQKTKLNQEKLKQRERSLLDENRMLAAHLHALKGEVFELKTQILKHGACGCEGITQYLGPSAPPTNNHHHHHNHNVNNSRQQQQHQQQHQQHQDMMGRRGMRGGGGDGMGRQQQQQESMAAMMMMGMGGGGGGGGATNAAPASLQRNSSSLSGSISG